MIADYEGLLAKLGERLRLAPMSAEDIAFEFKISKPTVYARLDALIAREWLIYFVQRSGRSGPPGMQFMSSRPGELPRNDNAVRWEHRT